MHPSYPVSSPSASVRGHGERPAALGRGDPPAVGNGSPGGGSRPPASRWAELGPGGRVGLTLNGLPAATESPGRDDRPGPARRLQPVPDLMRVRERLLRNATLFDEPAAYTAGVEDALQAVARVLRPGIASEP